MKIEPAKKEIKGVGLLEEKNIVASYYLFKKGFSKDICNQLNQKIKNFAGIHGGITAVTDDLTIIRLLSDNVMETQNVMMDMWNEIRRIMLGKEAVRIRKY